ncbi:MAG: sigma-54 dependent transcriptional regulator [Planctomycetota bacterium]
MLDDPIRLLLVEDEDDFRDSCSRWMQRKGHQVDAAASGAEALTLCASKSFEVAVFDMNMPGLSGMELLQRVVDDEIAMEVIILTGQGTIDMAVEAMKLGACDFLTKPCALGDLEHRCRLARDRGKLKRENTNLKAILSRTTPEAKLIGSSQAMRQIERMIQKVAPTQKPVLIQGESGTGKEVVARRIQQSSRLSDKPFVTINCAALPEQLVESELFGHMKGAFTGAVADKPGLFEIADGGTLFIDEVGELTVALQPKLLRVLEDGSLRRIGSPKEIHVDVRIIAATNRELRTEIDSGNFREDLYYRINVLSLQLPALRDREGDIEQLLNHFLDEGWEIDELARLALLNYGWPGNVRQMINVLERAMIMAEGNEIAVEDLPSELTLSSTPSPSSKSSSSLKNLETKLQSFTEGTSGQYATLEEVTQGYVQSVLRALDGNKSQAARALGIHRRKFYRLLDAHPSGSMSPDQIDEPR